MSLFIFCLLVLPFIQPMTFQPQGHAEMQTNNIYIKCIYSREYKYFLFTNTKQEKILLRIL